MKSFATSMAPIFLAFMVWIKKELTLEKFHPNISIIVADLNSEIPINFYF